MEFSMNLTSWAVAFILGVGHTQFLSLSSISALFFVTLLLGLEIKVNNPKQVSHVVLTSQVSKIWKSHVQNSKLKFVTAYIMLYIFF